MQTPGKLPLRLILVLPFILQIFAAVGLTAWLSLRNGQKAVNDMATQLMIEQSNHTTTHLNTYLEIPHQINQVNLAARELSLLDLENFTLTGHYFWKQMQTFDVGYINFANEQAEFIGVERLDDGTLLIHEAVGQDAFHRMRSYQTDSQGNRSTVEVVDEPSDVRQEGWYADAVQAGRPVWSDIYQWDDKPEVLSVSSSYPVHDQNQNLIGVIGVDLILSQIGNFLNQTRISPSSKTFILERDGLLVASCITEQAFQRVNDKVQRLKATESRDPLTQATARYLIRKFGNLDQINNNQQLIFQYHGARQFVQVTPWQDKLGLDWLIVVVVPESEFMAQIDANTRTTLLLCLGTLALVTVTGTLTARWITQPILRLTRAAKEIASGNLEQTVEVQEFKGIDELSILSQSFNQMARRLRESFGELETRVEQRTVDLKQAKDAADQANRTKSEFLAKMSHELRTPLNTILGFTQVINQDPTLTPNQRENLGIINRSGEHLLELINDVLDMSKIEAGHLTFHPQSFDLYQLLDALEKMLQLKASSKGLQLLFECASDTPQYVYTDKGKLRQVLLNLLGNAIKFTQAGKVVLRVGSIPHTLHFEVADTGPGIALDEMGTLFEAFTQTKTGHQSQEGTGLGLPISQQLVKLMGGDITVDSTAEQGTVFRFDVKVELSEVGALQSRVSTRQVIGLAPNQLTYRILIVDDRPENRKLLTKLLTPLGFQVREAANGQDAIDQWIDWDPHLIWMDIRMPVMDGYEATRQIKNRTATTQESCRDKGERGDKEDTTTTPPSSFFSIFPINPNYHRSNGQCL